MSLSSRGKRNSWVRVEVEHDIYAAYSKDDQQYVIPILDDLKQQRLRVYDPHVDALPNQTVLKAWLEHGICRSKITVVFLTKRFVGQSCCRFQTDNAIVRYARTKGRHRIIVVMLQSCKIPKNLQHFNCVYAWKLREQPSEQYARIHKAIFAPRDKFRRGSILWTNVNRNVAQIANKRVCEITATRNCTRQESPLLKYSNLLFNLGRVKLALENCELKCTSVHCGFRCSGDKIIDQFFSHIQVCKYQQVRCRFCRQTTLRKNLQKHEQTTCRRRHVSCPNESCGQKLPVTEMYSHAQVCSYKEIQCQNNVYGCTCVFERKDKAKHMEICDFEKVTCDKCSNLLFRVDLETHRCEVLRLNLECDSDDSLSFRENEVYQCYFVGCTFTGRRHDLQAHQLTCDLRIEQCADCGARFPYRDLVWHRRQCDRIVECELCHQSVPSSSKLTHDRYICNGQNIQSLCEVCHRCISSGRKETHSMSCVCGNLSTQNGMTSVNSTGFSSQPLLVQTNRTCSPQPDESFPLESGCGIRIPSHANHTSRLTPTYERLLYDVMPLQNINWRERSSSDDSDDSYSSLNRHHTWTPSSRDRWRALMHRIDNNENGLKMVSSNC